MFLIFGFSFVVLFEVYLVAARGSGGIRFFEGFSTLAECDVVVHFEAPFNASIKISACLTAASANLFNPFSDLVSSIIRQ